MPLVSTSRKQLFLFLGITLLVLSSAITLILWQEANHQSISAIAGKHQQLVVNSVKMKEELANMQLHVVLESTGAVNSKLSNQDLYGGQFSPAIAHYTLRSHFDAVIELQEIIGSISPVFEKLLVQINNFSEGQLQIDPAYKPAIDQTRIQLQSLLLTVDQLERFHSLKFKELTRKLDSTIRRDNRNLVVFLLGLALLSYLLMQWVQVLINRSLEQQHLSEKELLRSQQQLDNLLNALPDSVMRLGSDGTILEYRGRQLLFAPVKNNIIGKTLADMPIPNDVSQGLLDGIKTELASGQVYIYGFDLPKQDQSYEARIIKYGDNEVICIVRDITVQEVIRRQQEVLTAELEIKNAELERFVYTVSHDLKTPLVTINGYIGLLQQAIDANDAERIRNDLGQITRAARSMAELLDGLLELSRIGRIINPPEAGSLDYLVRNAADIVREKIVIRGIELEIDDNMPQYWGDRLRLLEVFQNLLENSIKFMGDQPEPRIKISALEDDNEVICKVQDNGIGIDPRYHDRIFNLFERLNPEIDGTGIGMSLVYRIVEAHGGAIHVESAGDKQGCTIVFTLPVKPQ